MRDIFYCIGGFALGALGLCLVDLRSLIADNLFNLRSIVWNAFLRALKYLGSNRLNGSIVVIPS